jgi:hypothetical protein
MMPHEGQPLQNALSNYVPVDAEWDRLCHDILHVPGMSLWHNAGPSFCQLGINDTEIDASARWEVVL